MYKYKEQKKELFTEDGQLMFIKIRDKSKALIQVAGSFRMENIMSSTTGDTWTMMACVDRMVEIGELIEVTRGDVAGQHRVFIKANQ
jgi:hypothetical protein